MTASATELPIAALSDPGGGGFGFGFRQIMSRCPIASHEGSGGSEVSTVRGLVGLVRLWFGFAHRLLSANPIEAIGGGCSIKKFRSKSFCRKVGKPGKNRGKGPISGKIAFKGSRRPAETVKPFDLARSRGTP
jgi:hypothetical protein